MTTRWRYCLYAEMVTRWHYYMYIDAVMMGLNNLVQAVNKHSSAYKLSINAAKTKIMELDKWQENTNIVIDNINVERVQSFQYLGAMFTTNGDGASNIKQRLAMAVQALNNMQYLWKSASKELKLKVLRTCIFPIATYGCETWVLRKLDIKRINAFEMKCYRKVLCIPWIAHRTNCSILNELHLPTNWMYNFVRRQKLKYFGHVTRHNGLEKTIMQGMVAGKRSRGKPRQRWEKDITDTFGTMAAASRVAKDRQQFRSDIWAATSWRGYAPRERMITRWRYWLNAVMISRIQYCPSAAVITRWQWYRCMSIDMESRNKQVFKRDCNVAVMIF